MKNGAVSLIRDCSLFYKLTCRKYYTFSVVLVRCMIPSTIIAYKIMHKTTISIHIILEIFQPI